MNKKLKTLHLFSFKVAKREETIYKLKVEKLELDEEYNRVLDKVKANHFDFNIESLLTNCVMLILYCVSNLFSPGMTHCNTSNLISQSNRFMIHSQDFEGREYIIGLF